MSLRRLRFPRFAVLAAALAAAAIVATTLGSAAAAGPTVIIGTKNFGEAYILGQLYKQALEAKGFTVDYKENIGSTEVAQTALTSGKINFMPEYTGIIVQVAFHKPLSPKTAAATWALAKQLEESKGFTLFNRTPFEDRDVLAVTNATAKKYGLHSVGDLTKVPNLSIAGFPEYKTRNTGLVGVKKFYGLKSVKFVPLSGISAYVLLDKGQVLAADVFTTDPPLAKPSKYTQLADPKNVSGSQNVAPIVSQKLAKTLGPKFRQTVDAVSSKLTLPAMIAMNTAFYVNKQPAASIAKAFLKANGLG
jgi:osmoprotectant transport system substrate-binding protein